MNSLIKTHDGDIHQDLLLAAEIGKNLLERNRELESILRSTQDYADEQTAQVEYYVKQIDILRESNESYSHSFEQLESSNKQLYDKYEQQQAENKILIGKNARLWEIISNLEKRSGDLYMELENVQAELHQMQNSLSETNNLNDDSAVYLDEKSDDLDNSTETIETSVKNQNSSNSTIDPSEHNTWQAHISELKVLLKIEKLQRAEIEAQLDDVINENQLLHHKISNLHQEIIEWERFAEKEENYRRLAEAFTTKHHVEIEADHQMIFQHTNGFSHLSPNTQNRLLKAKSCEFLHHTYKQECKILKTPTLVNNVLSSNNTSSFLSELDSEYADLLKRYEALLEKCKQEGRFIDNPEKTKKVQRAIQTLSFDFSKYMSQNSSLVCEACKLGGAKNSDHVSQTSCDETILHSPHKIYNKSNAMQVSNNGIKPCSPIKICRESSGTQTSCDGVETNLPLKTPQKRDSRTDAKGDGGSVDYRKMFADIFEVIKRRDLLDKD